MLQKLQEKTFFWGKKPGFDTGDLLHVGVNALFALVVFAMVSIKLPLLLTITLILLAKWRILAVKTRFWWPNIKANLVDIIVGVATVDLLYQTNETSIRIFWTILFAIWLIFIKPRSSDLFIALQAVYAQSIGLIALFAGITSTANLANATGIFGLFHNLLNLLRLNSLDGYIVPVFVCASTWLMAWSAARHFFSNYEEPMSKTLSLAWAFILSQSAWVSLHWLHYYTIFSVKIVLLALCSAVISITLGSIYVAYRKETLKKSTFIENMVIGGILLLVILGTAKW